MKLFSSLFKLCLLLAILAVIFRDFTCRFAFSFGLSWALGVPVKVNSARVGLMDTELELSGIDIKNPSDFGGGPLAKIDNLYLDFEISSLWEGKIHFETVELHLSEIHVTQLERGRWNILELKPMEASSESKSNRSREREDKASRSPLVFVVDRLILTIDQATYSDLSSGVAKVKVIPINIRKAQYQGIQSTNDILKIVVWETLKRMGVSGLSGILHQIEGDLGFSGVESVQGFFEKTLAAVRGRL